MEPRIAGDYAPQPTTTTNEREHPRYAEYVRYRDAVASQLVSAATFSRWLSMTEDSEKRVAGARLIETPAPRAE